VISSICAAYRWSSCAITWKNCVFSLLTSSEKSAPRLGRTTWLAAWPRTTAPAQPHSISSLAVSCLQAPCFVGVTNVACQYSSRQSRNYDKYSLLSESQTLGETQRSSAHLPELHLCASEVARLSVLLCCSPAGLVCGIPVGLPRCGAALQAGEDRVKLL
jgi:hypothetical protein